MDTLILCAGFGTRLQPVLGNNLPKPLVEVAGKPIITHIIEKLEHIPEVKRVNVVTNELYFNHFLNWRETIQTKTRLTIKIINDKVKSAESRLGSIGDVYYTMEKEYLQAPLLVIAGDNLFDFSLNPFMQMFKEKKAPLVSLCNIENKELLKSLGNAIIDESSRIVSFIEKPANPYPEALAATAIYLYTAETMNDLRQYVRENDDLDKSGSFIQWLHKKRPVYGCICKGKFFDVGTPETLEQAQKAFSA